MMTAVAQSVRPTQFTEDDAAELYQFARGIHTPEDLRFLKSAIADGLIAEGADAVSDATAAAALRLFRRICAG